MHILFVQPRSYYPVNRNLLAFSLTFPQLVADLELSVDDYSIHIEDSNSETFENVLDRTHATHVFITAITSTFPRAVEIASFASRQGATVAIGGLFTTLNAETIRVNFPVFDYVVSGCPTVDLIRMLAAGQSSRSVLQFDRRYTMRSLTGHMMARPFKNAYKGDCVCYELGCGCPRQCGFCTLQHARQSRSIRHQSAQDAKRDLDVLSRHWTRLKLIDDDILLSCDTLRDLELNNLFDQVIAETCVDRLLDRNNVDLLKRAGVTHVLFGAESFNDKVIRRMRNLSSPTGETISYEIHQAVANLRNVGIIARPVVMFTTPDMTLTDLELTENEVVGWTAESGVELLAAFYTPHPGTDRVASASGFLTNDLQYFDHLHPVYVPTSLGSDGAHAVVQTYDRIVAATGSQLFNPNIEQPDRWVADYECFFK